MFNLEPNKMNFDGLLRRAMLTYGPYDSVNGQFEERPIRKFLNYLCFFTCILAGLKMIPMLFNENAIFYLVEMYFVRGDVERRKCIFL